MNSVENISSARLPKKTEPEEYDLVVLGSEAGSNCCAERMEVRLSDDLFKPIHERACLCAR
jgi:hypothetical protein